MRSKYSKAKFLFICLSVYIIMGSGHIYAETTQLQTVPRVVQNTQVVEDLQTVNPDKVEIQKPVDATVKQPMPPTTQLNYKQPVSKKMLVKKFLMAMVGVIVSSVLIFFVLSLYNRIRYGVQGDFNEPYNESSLKTPDNIDEAVASFLDKTDWK